MAYITNSITSANPSADLYTAMATALTTAGYTLVDTNVISTRTHKIWKSAAANNSQNLDWYLDVCYTTTGAGNMWLFPMEFFDPATDLGYRMAQGVLGLVTAVEQTYYSRLGATGYALESAPSTTNASNATAQVLTTSTSTFGYWISITGNRVIALTSIAPTSLVYSGFFTPSAGHIAAAGSSIFPLIYSVIDSYGISFAQTTTNNTASITRYPKAAALTGNGWGAIPRTSGPTDGASANLLTFGPQLSPGPLTVNSAYQIWPINIGVGTASSPAAHLGSLTDVGVLYATGVARGDTLTVSGQQWVLGSVANSSVFTFKAV